MRNIPFLALALLAFGCGGSESTTVVADSATDSASDGTSSDASGDAPVDASGGPCGDKTCTAGQLCSRTFTSGGPCQPCGDGGTCPTGSHCSGSCCVVDKPTYTYNCITLPAACAAGVTCTGGCGSALCTGGCPCESIEGSTVTCHCLAP